MHVCQIMLIEADNAEEAFEQVASALEENPSWSDWHNANFSNVDAKNFADRWTGTVFGTPDKNGVYNADEAPNFLRYSEDPALAERAITSYLDQRFNDIRSYQAKAVDLASYKYDPYKSGWDTNLYSTKKLAELLNDDWTCDTAIYDLTTWSANLNSFIERVKTNPDKQWLIPVDFHF